MRFYFIAACVLSLIYVVATVAIAEEVREARRSSWSVPDYSYGNDYYDYDYSYSDYSDDSDDATRMGGIVSVLYMGLCLTAFLLALMKIKTQTMKVISIIGLSIAGLFLLWAMLPLASPGSVSFDEVAPAFMLAGIALLALHIVGIVHAFKTST